jgi:precorrin-2/cobalt-factor-2 C20-methyltransferase
LFFGGGEMKKIYFTGTGPGDPELLTRKAVRVIREADVIFVPGNKGRNMALDTIEEFTGGKRIKRLEFPMGQVTNKDYDRAVDVISEEIPEEGMGVFVTIGDPMIYSTAIYLMERLSEVGMSMEVVSGIPSFVAAAGRSLVPLTIKGEALYVCDEFQESALREADTIAILKTNKDKGKILEALEGERFQITYISKATLEDERIIRDVDESIEEDAYMSMIIGKRQKGELKCT